MDKKNIESLLTELSILDPKSEEAGAFSVKLAAAFGVVPAECYFDGFDPECGSATYTSDEYLAETQINEQKFDATGELDDMPEHLYDHIGSIPNYTADLSAAIELAAKAGFGPTWEFHICVRNNDGSYLQHAKFYDSAHLPSEEDCSVYNATDVCIAVCGVILREVLRRGPE